jgi:hypothetical protein
MLLWSGRYGVVRFVCVTVLAAVCCYPVIAGFPVIYIRMHQDRFKVQGWLLQNERVDQAVAPAAFRVFRLDGDVPGL